MQKIIEDINALITQLRDADASARAPILASITALCKGPKASAARSHLEDVARGEILELQWELEDILDATAPPKKAAAPPPSPEPEPVEEPPDPKQPLTAKDLDIVYDDPRGLVLHRTKDGARWFATQVDPRTSQPQTFELHAEEIGQLKQQLTGSPYWVVGGGGPSLSQ